MVMRWMECPGGHVAVLEYNGSFCRSYLALGDTLRSWDDHGQKRSEHRSHESAMAAAEREARRYLRETITLDALETVAPESSVAYREAEESLYSADYAPLACLLALRRAGFQCSPQDDLGRSLYRLS